MSDEIEKEQSSVFERARTDANVAAAMVAKVVDLRSVRLTSIVANMSTTVDDFLRVVPKWRVPRPSVAHVFVREDNVLHVRVSLAVQAFHSRSGANVEDENAVDSPSEAVVTVGGTMELEYRLTAPAPPADVEEILFGGFAKLNGIHNAWPYFRELVQSTTGRMGIPPFTLPSYRISNNKKEPTPPSKV